ncbi:MAG TPA: GNAT family N-acetyltransferase [Gaiellaceae bacterium]|jgi:GNAT superfamily N-acetyltransferase
MEFTSRLATLADVPRLTEVMDAAISELQRAYLDDAQVEASRAVMGIDTQLIEDGTYFVIETIDGDVAGCGGWSRRGTMYGNDHSPGRDAKLLDPGVDAARVRAMYTSPAYARRGVGRLVLQLCEAAAAAEGFTRLELVGTLAGEPLYAAYGFVPVERLDASVTEVPVPCVRMTKPVTRT